jgi:leucyl aminopeptidase (aminopeptidase T)
MSLIKAADIVLKKCMGLKDNETILIVTDSELRKIGDAFLQSALTITSNAELEEIPIPKFNGAEPPEDIANDMLNFHVNILVTSKSLSHTTARKNASKKGVRIATLPGVTEDMMERCIDIDYDKLKELTKKINDVLDEGKEVRITTALGTDLTFSIDGRAAFGDDSGIYDKEGLFGNLPAGESYISPMEGTANGTFIVDASYAGVGKLSEPIKVTVKDGFATDFEGKGSDILKESVESVGKQGRNIAEFGVGTNEKAIITGSVLEDEKVFGTCHIAIGNNTGFGGNVNVPLHLDGIITKPTIWVDNKKIMEEGNLLI